KGRPFALDLPSASGPRNCGQFSCPGALNATATIKPITSDGALIVMVGTIAEWIRRGNVHRCGSLGDESGIPLKTTLGDLDSTCGVYAFGTFRVLAGSEPLRLVR